MTTTATYWNKESIEVLYNLSFFELIIKAHEVHKQNFNSTEIEWCEILSIKTGACPEDCSYCPQSGRYKTGIQKEKLWDLEKVVERAKAAKEYGVKRFCMGAAWKNPPEKDFPQVLEMIKAVKALGLETCVTLGTLNADQAQQLKDNGLDYYNHNLDTSPAYYKKIISTHTQEDRVETLKKVNSAGINVCCGGIIGMGETREDRVNFFLALLALPQPLNSVPINRLIATPGTPLANTPQIDNFEFIRSIAIARILFPTARVRLSAGRESMSEEMQAWCFMAGANSMWYGDKLLTAKNTDKHNDLSLLERLGMRIEGATAAAC